LVKRFLVIPVIGIFFGIVSLPAYSQFYTQGDDPASLHWEQIHTNHFQVIFPEEFVDEASRLCSILEFYYPSNSSFLNHQPSRIPVVLHNQSVLSNGFVAWAPRRMELVTTPPPDNYPEDYITQLALHEFRHVVQVDKLNQGFTKGLHYLIGQQAAGVTGLLPFWYLEGDAVDAETRLSHSGRGRLPSFEMEMKAIVAGQTRLYSYEKAYYGSYRDHIPDYYQLGYQMVAYARNKYGNELWENVMNYTARNPFTLYPIYFSLKKYTGLSKKRLYQNTFYNLKDYWQKQAESRTPNQFRIINKSGGKSYSNYSYPCYVNDSLIFAEKSGIDQIEEFVLIDTGGKETRIHTPGFGMPGNISVAGNRIAWAEVIQDQRWGNRSFSVIKIYDLNNHKERTLAWRTKYFSPDLSSDGKKIVAVATDTRNRYALVILDASTGQLIDSVPSPGNKFLQYPVWSADDRELFATGLTDAGKWLMKYNCEEHNWQNLFNSGFEDIAELSSSKNYLFFRGTFSGIDNIYAFEFATDKVFRITCSTFGAYYPDISADEKRLLYSDYTSLGFNVVETDLNHAEWIILEELPEKTEQLNIPTREEEENIPVYTNKPGEEYLVRPFRKSGDLFNFHSWSPFYFNYTDPDIEQPKVSPGISLLSQNKLGTAITFLGYEYREGEHYLHSNFIYSGFLPVFKTGIDYGGYPFVAKPPGTEQPPDKVKTDLNYRLEVSLPLNMTVNKMVSGVQPSIEINHSREYFFYEDPWGYKSGMTYLNYRLYTYSYLKTSLRDILPRRGGVADISFANTPFESEQIGSVFTAKGIIYLPGISRHHTLRTNISYQKQNPARYVFNNIISLPRGYTDSLLIRMSSLTFDYVFPIAYPDLGNDMAYLKRIRAAFFFDYATGQNIEMKNVIFRSAGLELMTDVHLFHIFFPFNIGIRLIYLPDRNKVITEPVFSMDLNKFL
jgi:hypothetical protein